MQRAFWRTSKLLFFVLFLLAVIGIAAQAFVPSALMAEDGCYWSSTLIAYIDCPDVPAGGAIAFVLNLPSWVFTHLHEFAYYLVASGMVFESDGKPLFWVLVSLVCLLLLGMGGLFPFRWLYERHRARPAPGTVRDRSPV